MTYSSILVKLIETTSNDILRISQILDSILNVSQSKWIYNVKFWGKFSNLIHGTFENRLMIQLYVMPIIKVVPNQITFKLANNLNGCNCHTIDLYILLNVKLVKLSLHSIS